MTSLQDLLDQLSNIIAGLKVMYDWTLEDIITVVKEEYEEVPT